MGAVPTYGLHCPACGEHVTFLPKDLRWVQDTDSISVDVLFVAPHRCAYDPNS